VPNRSLRDWLDKHGGSKLNELSAALSAGREINTPTDKLLYDSVTRPVGKAALRASRHVPDLSSHEPTLQEIMRQLVKVNSVK
jgi:hypothetical protein